MVLKIVWSYIFAILLLPVAAQSTDCRSTLNKQAQELLDKGEYKQARTLFLKALNAHSGKPDLEQARSMSGYASIYAYTGQAERTLPLFEESVPLIRQMYGEQHEIYYNAINNLAMLYLRTDHFAEAEPLLLKCLQIRKELTGTENPVYIKALNNLAVMYLDMGSFERAAELFREVVALSSRVLGETSKSHLLGLSNLGLCYMRSGQTEAAIEITDMCEEIFEQRKLTESTFAEIRGSNLMMMILCGKDDPQMGEKLAQCSATLKALFGERNLIYQSTLNVQANYYIKKQDYVRALEYAELDLATVGKYRGKETLVYMKSLSNKGSVCYMLHRWAEAEKTFAECLDVARRLASENLAFMSDREREEYWHSVREPLDNIAGLARFADLNNYHSPALAVLLYDRSLLTKSLLLNYSADLRKSVLESGDQELISIWQQLKKLKSAPSPDAEKIEELDKQLSLRSMPYRNQKSDFSATWQNVRDQLADNEAAVEIVTIVSSTMKPRYAGLVIRPGAEAPQCEMLCAEQTIATALHDPQQAATELTSMLFTPLEKHLQGVSRIYLSVSGLASNVSFAGMKDRRGYLSDRYSLCNLLTTKDIFRSKQRPIFSQTPTIALFGGADFGLLLSELYDAPNTANQLRGQGFDYLPGSKKEIMSIRGLLTSHGWQSAVYTDKQATESHFKAYSSASPDVIHISTHGYYFSSANAGTEAGLQLKTSADPLTRCGLLFSGANNAWNGVVTATASDDGILTGAEIALMNLSRTQLVVLSACNTALGDNDYSEGIYGLQRAFRIAGTPMLLVTLWPIPDRETTQFMTEFYEHLTKGAAIRDAFNATMRTMRKQYPSVPEVWAGFVLVE